MGLLGVWTEALSEAGYSTELVDVVSLHGLPQLWRDNDASVVKCDEMQGECGSCLELLAVEHETEKTLIREDENLQREVPSSASWRGTAFECGKSALATVMFMI